MLEKRLKNNTGITLIVLVVTIIVLLILAGISISMLTGQNGILNRAAEAKEKTENAGMDEQGRLNNYEEQISNYVGIDWEQAKASAKAPVEQKEERNNGVIGIGTDGKPVNMDLWEYTNLEDGTFALNDIDSVNDTNKSKGYLGKINNGQIDGKVVQYISIDYGKSYFPVTSMISTFCELDSLTQMPELPSTVKNMTNCFIRCSNLENITKLPSNLEDLSNTFKGCTSLKVAPEIPSKVINMYGTFSECINLKVAPKEIPASVQNIALIFLNCENLNGEITINANVSGKTIGIDSAGGEIEDFYRAFYQTSLKSNNTVLNVKLNSNLYEKINSKRNKVLLDELSNINFSIIKD